LRQWNWVRSSVFRSRSSTRSPTQPELAAWARSLQKGQFLIAPIQCSGRGPTPAGAELYRSGRTTAAGDLFARYDSLEAKVGAAFATGVRSRLLQWSAPAFVGT